MTPKTASNERAMSPLENSLAAEIQATGPVPFARFMERALYEPEHGYYERSEPVIGRGGDFYTSVSVGPLFGELLALRFSEWLEDFDGGAVQLVEAGAHDGRLAGDILGFLREYRPTLFGSIEYIILEPSARWRARQAAALADVAPQVRWAACWAEFPAHSVRGVIFSNELLDALPVHRIGWDAQARAWFEWGVGFDSAGGRFDWVRLPLSETVRNKACAFYQDPPEELAEVLPDEFTLDLSPAAEAWWKDAAAALGAGHLLTIDYGLRSEEFFASQRTRGTLRGFRAHKPVRDLLEGAGTQDLTAHVNFSALTQAGESQGLETAGICGQSEFLVEIAARAWAPGAAFPSWTPERTRQLQTLIHPEHLGRSFSVLVQTRRKYHPFRPILYP